jgi:hypothetical protein
MEYYSQAKLFTMKYYRFNRKGRYDTFSLNTYLKSQKKTEYMVNTKRSKKLDSFFLENQVWGALHKCWKGYTIAKNKDEYDKMEIYARRIQECQHDLGLPISSFDDIGMSAMERLQSEDIANAILYAIQAPAHLNVNEILMRPTAQER